MVQIPLNRVINLTDDEAKPLMVKSWQIADEEMVS
jgi:hypothetical protein